MNWTKAQLSAINGEGKDILLSAAAGSGKTTVMVERVYRLVKSGCDIESLLIITFTRAAAADMKRKLLKRFSEDARDKNIVSALDGIERASICTIDSYCSYVLRQHFEAADVDPNFRILDDAEERQMQSRAIDQALEKAMADPSEGLVSLLFGREIKSVKDMVKKLYAFSRAQPDQEGFLNKALIEMPSSDGEIWFSALLKYAHRLLIEALAYIKKCVEISSREDGPNVYLPSVREDEFVISEMLETDYDALSRRAASFSLTKIAALRVSKNDALAENRKLWGDKVKELRKKAADCLKQMSEALPPREYALSDTRLSLNALAALKELCDDYGEALWSLKTDRAAMSFADVAQLALRVLDDEQVAAYQKSRFKYVFVDEYQDVSDIQEAIIKRVAEPGRLFMVGDVKQSIYRFRQAVPELFIEKYDRFAATGEGTLVCLSNNFRSRGAIIDLVNGVFSSAMNSPTSEMPYLDDARLVMTRESADADAPVELHIFDKAASQDGYDEAMMTAELVKSLIGQSLTPASDRKIRPGDIAILARTRDTLRLISQALGDLSIKSYVDAAEGYLEAIEVRLTLSLMRAVENRRRDFPLLETLRSPIIGLSSTQLAEIRARFPDGAYCDSFNRYMELGDKLAQKLREIKADFDRWRFLSRQMPLPDWIDLLLNETGFYAYAGALPGGRARQSNLDLLCNYASDFSATKTGGLTGFLDYMTDVESLGGDMSAAHEAADIGDCVVLMTVHKSKGLEFPVVIAAGLGKALARSRADAGELKLHRTLGAGLYYNDDTLGTRRDTLIRSAIEAASDTEALEEEKRVLYVMLTRATDRLMLTGFAPGREAWEFRRSCPELSAINPASFLDMVSGFVDDGSVFFHDKSDEQQATMPEAPTEAADSKLYDEAREALMWEYPYEDDAWQPVKLTVTGLARELTGAVEASPIVRTPRFLSDASYGLERGTLIHQALSAIDLNGLKGLDASSLDARLKRDAQRLYASGIIPSPVDTAPIARFLTSDLGQRLLSSHEIKREWQFNLRMSVREALNRDSDSRIIVQGMIDCCFKEAGEWVLIDYKTDYKKEDAPVEYANQVKLYALALERITKLPVKESYLCFLSSGVNLPL